MAKTHKNKAGISCYYAVGILCGNNEMKFITSLDNNKKISYWEENLSPMLFDSKQFADDIAYGLLLNGYPVMVIEMPECLEGVKNTKGLVKKI